MSNTTIIDQATEQLAEYFCDILVDDTIDQPAAMTKLFEDFGAYLKAEIQPPNSATDADKAPLSAALNELVAELVASARLRHINPLRARRWLLTSRHGQSLLAQHIKTKKAQTPMTDIFKLSNVNSVYEVCKNISGGSVELSELDFTRMVSGHANLTKQSFEKVFQDREIQKAYAVVREAGYIKGLPNMMSTAPTSVQVGDTNTDGSAEAEEAAAKLADLADKQHALAPFLSRSQIYDLIYADPANKALVHRAHGRSSTSGSELQN
jgi:hypothetical protein